MFLQRNIFYAATIGLFLTVQATLEDGAVEVIDKRAPYYGGYSLQIPVNVPCPAETISCSGAFDSQDGPCCPAGTYCAALGPLCCPTTDSCNDAVFANPTCADPSWVLFIEPLAGNEHSAVCCPSGTVVDYNNQCVAPGGSGTSAQYSTYVQATQFNDATPPASRPTNSGGTTPASTASAAATTTRGTTSTASVASPTTSPSSPGTGNVATGNSGTPTTPQSSPASTSQKSEGYKTIQAYEKVAWAMVLFALLN